MMHAATNYLSPGTITSTGRTKIHPLNASYLCSKLPHRIFEDADGARLELTVQPISPTVVEKHCSHGGIIWISYQTHFSQQVLTLLLSHEGDIARINEHGYMDPEVLEDDTLYMLLNPVEINGWYALPSHTPESRKVMRDIGMKVPRDRSQKLSEALEYAIEQTQKNYRRILFHV